MTCMVRGAEATTTHFRPCLKHKDGCVITVHRKAWMDSAGVAMWVATQLSSSAGRMGRRALVVWDNCGPHSAPAVRAALAEHDIRAETLPPRMTSVLQVMDLVVNGPLKAAIRGARARALFKYFQKWKFAWVKELAKSADARAMPAFAPPKPVLADGLRALLTACGDAFIATDFQRGLRRAFEDVGLAPDASGRWTTYAGHTRGLLSRVLAPADSAADDQFLLGDVAAELAMAECPAEGHEEEDEGGCSRSSP